MTGSIPARDASEGRSAMTRAAALATSKRPHSRARRYSSTSRSSSSSAAGIIGHRDRCSRSRSRSRGSTAGSGGRFSRARTLFQSSRPPASPSEDSSSRIAARSGVSASPARAAWIGVRPFRAGLGVSGQTSPRMYARCSRLSRSASSSERSLGRLHCQLRASRCRGTFSITLVRGCAGGIVERAAAVNRSTKRSSRLSS